MKLVFTAVNYPQSFWDELTTKEIEDIIKTAPGVAGRWRKPAEKEIGNKLGFDDVVAVRDITVMSGDMNPVTFNTDYYAVKIYYMKSFKNPGPYYWITMYDAGAEPTLPKAKKAANKSLKNNNWRLK